MSNSFLQQRFPALVSMLIGMGLLIWALFSDERLLNILFQPQGLALILGGTLSAAMLGFSWQELVSSLSNFLIAFSGTQEPELQDIFDTTVYLAQQIREAESPENAQRLLETVRSRLPQNLLREGLGLIGGGYTATMIRETLETRLALTSIQKERQIRLWKFMGKMAPIFGLGATLVVLLQLTQSPQEQATLLTGIGSALVCLLYGVLFSGLIFLPVAEQLEAWRVRQLHYLQMCLESVILLQQRHHPLYVESVLKPFLHHFNSPVSASAKTAMNSPPSHKNTTTSFRQVLSQETAEITSENKPMNSETGNQNLTIQQLRQFRPIQRRPDSRP